MQKFIWLTLTLIANASVYAEELERSTITTCAYQAGTAREIQTIRQTEGDDWPKFEQTVMKIYADSQGRSDLLVIAKRVYLQPTDESPDVVYSHIFNACAKRIQETEVIF